MSIRQQLKALEGLDPPRLWRFPSVGGNAKRRLFLGGQALTEYNDLNSASNFAVGRGVMVAQFTRWTRGDLVWRIGKRGGFLDSLHPPPEEVFELKIIGPTYHVRGIGVFAEANTLVVLRLHTRAYLDGKWEQEMLGALSDWDNLLPGISVFKGGSILDYVTENCDDFPLKFTRP